MVIEKFFYSDNRTCFGDKDISNHSFAVYLNSNSKRQLRLTPYYICGADAKTSTVAVGQE